MIDPKLISILRKVDLFQDAPQDALEQLAPTVTRHEYAQNQLVIRKGDLGDSLFIIAGGQVRVHDGDQVVARLGAGNFFGEISFLDTAPRSMSVSADIPSVLYRITRDDFYKVFRNHPEVTQIILSTLTGRLRNQNEQVIRDLRMREAELSKLVDERTHALQETNNELSKTLAELKSTQEQLIRQEKLASLGQLTAGIAHEIKNPLNFVNNFAKLSLPLVDDIVTADSKEERTELGGFLRTNLEKIYAHGSRADVIVKGMLEHTRTGSGMAKYPIDINKMCQQVVQQSLESFREQYPDFECSVTLDLDSRLPRVEVSASDFSKMLGNMYNNAFYAIREKSLQRPPGYQPVLTISTSLSNGRMMLAVKDNGTGMSPEVKEQAFNPFFTTKPSGDGAGLGLSISHDIVVAHRGNIVCESQLGQGSVFVISVPIQETEQTSYSGSPGTTEAR